MAKAKPDPVLKELEAIKKLLVLQLVTSGVQARAVGKVLGLSKPKMSALVPARSVKKRR